LPQHGKEATRIFAQRGLKEIKPMLLLREKQGFDLILPYRHVVIEQ
jgi:hypothetical protein